MTRIIVTWETVPPDELPIPKPEEVRYTIPVTGLYSLNGGEPVLLEAGDQIKATDHNSRGEDKTNG